MDAFHCINCGTELTIEPFADFRRHQWGRCESCHFRYGITLKLGGRAVDASLPETADTIRITLQQDTDGWYARLEYDYSKQLTHS